MNKSTEYYFVVVIIIAIALTIGFLGAQVVGSLYYNKLISNNPALEDFKDTYTNKINLMDDPNELARMGTIFLKSDFNDLALLSFKKASDLSPNWRDAWVWRGYAELRTNQPKAGLDSLKKAENLDPIYPLTYQFLTDAYKLTGDAVSAEKAQEKFVYLNKTYKK